MKKKSCLLALLLFFGCVVSGIAQTRQQYDFAIEPGPLQTALKNYSAVTSVHLTYLNKLVANVQSKGLRGTWPAQKALEHLLEETGLVASFIRPDSAVLKKKPAPDLQTPEADLGTLLVQGKQEQDFDNTLPQVDSLDYVELQKEGATDLKTSTRHLPGVSVFKARKGGQSSGFNIRGIGAAQQYMGENRVLMTIDGERLPDHFNFGHNSSIPMIAGRDNVDFDTIKRMDVIKGPQSALYGSDGIGGAVNFRTYDPQDFVDDTKKWYAGGKYGYRSANSQHKGTVTLAGKKGPVSGLLIASKTDAKEYSSYKKTEPWDVVYWYRESQDPQWIDGHNLLGKMYIGDDTHRISLTGERYFREYDTMLLGDAEAAKGTPAGTLNTVRRRRVSLGYRFQPQNNWLDVLKLKIYNQHLHNSDQFTNIHPRLHHIADPTKFDYKSFGNYRQNIWAIKADWAGHFDTGNLHHAWTTGAEYRWENSERTECQHTYRPGSGWEIITKKYLPDMDANTLAVYIQDSITLPSGLVVTPGVRYEKWRYRPTADASYLASNPEHGAELAAKEMDNSTICPKLRVSYPFTNYLTGYGSIAWGGKNPPLQLINGMVNPNHITILPGTDLKPEKTRNHELGLLYNSPKLDINLVGFYNIYKEMFQFNFGVHPLYGPGLLPSNVENAKIYGTEASFTWRFYPDWFLKGSLSYAKGTRDKKNFHPFLQGNLNSDWRGNDPLQGIIGLGYDNSWFGFNLDCFMSKPYKQDVVEKEEIITPGFAVVDISGWWKINDYLEINAGVYNLLDKKYWQGIDLNQEQRENIANVRFEKFTMPGINFILGLKMHF